MSTSRGDVTISRWKKRSIDCKKIDNPSARRKTPLKKAPCHENKSQRSNSERNDFIPTNSARWKAYVKVWVYENMRKCRASAAYSISGTYMLSTFMKLFRVKRCQNVVDCRKNTSTYVCSKKGNRTGQVSECCVSIEMRFTMPRCPRGKQIWSEVLPSEPHFSH